MSRRGSAVNSQSGGTTSATVKATYSGIAGIAAGDIFVGIIGINSGTITLNSLQGAATAGHDWTGANLSPSGALPVAGDSQAGNIETWLIVRKLTAQDITDGFVTATFSVSGRCFFTGAVYTGGTGTWQTPPAVAKATASTLTGPSLTTVGISSDVVTVGGARNASLSTFPVISFGTGFTTDNTDGTANAASANEGGATGHLTTPVAAGTVVGGQSISATNTPTQIVAYLVELDPLTAKSLTDTGTGADAITVAASFTLADTAHGTDAATVAPSVPLADTATGADALTANATFTLADTGTATDALSVVATFTLADTGTGADAISVNAGSTPVTLADTGTAADAVTVTVTAAQSDTGTGSDALTVAASVALADTATGTDAATVSATVPLADTAHGTDALTANATVPLSDVGTATDAATIAATVPLADTAQGVDTAAVTAALSLADTAATAEAFAAIVAASLADVAAATDTLSVVKTGGPNGYLALSEATAAGMGLSQATATGLAGADSTGARMGLSDSKAAGLALTTTTGGGLGV